MSVRVPGRKRVRGYPPPPPGGSLIDDGGDSGRGPIVLVQVHVDPKDPYARPTFTIPDEAARFLSSIPPGFAMVVLNGEYRGGKSFLLNCLMKMTGFSSHEYRKVHNPEYKRQALSNEGNMYFSVDGSVQACTRGLLIHRQPVKSVDPVTGRSFNTYIVDTEGFGATDVGASYDDYLFAISMFMGSFLVFNVMQRLGSGTFNSLKMVMEICKRLQFSRTTQAPGGPMVVESMMGVEDSALLDSEDEEKKGERKAVAVATQKSPLQMAEEIGTSFTPKLLFLIRDFNLALKDKDKKAITPAEYLNEQLGTRPYAECTTVPQQVSALLRAYFPPHKRMCVTMPPPCDKSMFSVMSQVPITSLDEEFQRKLKKLVDIIQKEGIPRVTIGKDQKSEISGAQYLDMCRSFLKALNSGKAPVIKDMWTNMAERQCMEAREQVEKSTRINIMKLEHEAQRRMRSVLVKGWWNTSGPPSSSSSTSPLKDLVEWVEFKVDTTLLHAQEQLASSSMATASLTGQQRSQAKKLEEVVSTLLNDTRQRVYAEISSTVFQHINTLMVSGGGDAPISSKKPRNRDESKEEEEEDEDGSSVVKELVSILKQLIDSLSFQSKPNAKHLLVNAPGDDMPSTPVYARLTSQFREQFRSKLTARLLEQLPTWFLGSGVSKRVVSKLKTAHRKVLVAIQIHLVGLEEEAAKLRDRVKAQTAELEEKAEQLLDLKSQMEQQQATAQDQLKQETEKLKSCESRVKSTQKEFEKAIAVRETNAKLKAGAARLKKAYLKLQKDSEATKKKSSTTHNTLRSEVANCRRALVGEQQKLKTESVDKQHTQKLLADTRLKLQMQTHHRQAAEKSLQKVETELKSSQKRVDMQMEKFHKLHEQIRVSDTRKHNTIQSIKTEFEEKKVTMVKRENKLQRELDRVKIANKSVTEHNSSMSKETQRMREKCDNLLEQQQSMKMEIVTLRAEKRSYVDTAVGGSADDFDFAFLNESPKSSSSN